MEKGKSKIVWNLPVGLTNEAYVDLKALASEKGMTYVDTIRWALHFTKVEWYDYQHRDERVPEAA